MLRSITVVCLFTLFANGAVAQNDTCVKSVAIGNVQIESGPVTPIFEVTTALQKFANDKSTGHPLGAGSVDQGFFEVVKKIDGTSPRLFEYAATYSPIGQVKITITGAKSAPVMILDLEGVHVAGYSLKPNACQDEVLERIQFTCARVHATVGTIISCYDFAARKRC